MTIVNIDVLFMFFILELYSNLTHAGFRLAPQRKKWYFCIAVFCAATSKHCGEPWCPVAGCIVYEMVNFTCDAPAGGTYVLLPR